MVIRILILGEIIKSDGKNEKEINFTEDFEYIKYFEFFVSQRDFKLIDLPDARNVKTASKFNAFIEKLSIRQQQLSIDFSIFIKSKSSKKNLVYLVIIILLIIFFLTL